MLAWSWSSDSRDGPWPGLVPGYPRTPRYCPLLSFRIRWVLSCECYHDLMRCLLAALFVFKVHSYLILPFWLFVWLVKVIKYNDVLILMTWLRYGAMLGKEVHDQDLSLKPDVWQELHYSAKWLKIGENLLLFFWGKYLTVVLRHLLEMISMTWIFYHLQWLNCEILARYEFSENQIKRVILVSSWN